MKRFIFLFALLLSLAVGVNQAQAQNCAPGYTAYYPTFTMSNGCDIAVSFCCIVFPNNTVEIQIKRIRFNDFSGCWGNTIPNMDLAFWNELNTNIYNLSCGLNAPPYTTVRIIKPSCMQVDISNPELYFSGACTVSGICEYVYDVNFNGLTFDLRLQRGYPRMNGVCGPSISIDDANLLINSWPPVYSIPCVECPCR